MKKYLWVVFVWVMVLYSSVRLSIYAPMINKAKEVLDYDIFYRYFSNGRTIGCILTFVCFICCISFMLRAAKEADGKQLFFLFPILVFVKCCADVSFIILSENELCYLKQEIDQLLGNAVKPGHPSGIVTIGAVLIAIIELIIAIVFMSVSYAKNKKASKEKQNEK